MLNNYEIRLKSEGDGTICKDITLTQAIQELSHQFKTNLWEMDDIYQVILDGDIVAEYNWNDAHKLF